MHPSAPALASTAASATANPRGARIAWIAVAIGLVALYGPTYRDFLFGYWAAESQGHELLVLAAAAWLFYRKRQALRELPAAGHPWTASVVLALGLAAYLLGRQLSQMHVNIRIELTSQFLVILALLLAYRGWRGVGVVWFPLLFLLFVMPLPGSVAAAVTMPLKHAVSTVAVNLLHGLNYPVGQNGVVITIGQYQLLVAEACAGLQTLFTLEAVGLLYVNLLGYASPWRNALMSLLAIPAAFAANVVRVVVLVLVTYHFGDAAGRGFVHDFAGIVLFVAALGALMLANQVVNRVWVGAR